MSEQRPQFDWVGLILTVGILTALVLVAYFEIDSRIQLSQLRDLQRRVGQLESRK